MRKPKGEDEKALYNVVTLGGRQNIDEDEKVLHIVNTLDFRGY